MGRVTVNQANAKTAVVKRDTELATSDGNILMAVTANFQNKTLVAECS